MEEKPENWLLTLLKEDASKDSIGDCMVVLKLMQAKQFGTSLEECYDLAYDDPI